MYARISDLEDTVDTSIASPAAIQLRPYQVEGAKFLKQYKGAILADAVGLGKTIQALCAADKPALIVCRAYLVDQWRDVIRENFPNDTVEVANGPVINRLVAIRRQADWTITGHHSFMSRRVKTGRMKYDNFYGEERPETVKVPLIDWDQYDYETIIIDESHVFRGHTSTLSENMARICKRVPRRYLLTGTPIVKDNDDLYMQLHLVDPRRFSSYWRFTGEHSIVVKEQYGMKIVGNKNPHRLRQLLKDYMLERTYKQVGLQLPRLNKSVVKVDLDEKEEKAYKMARDSYKKELADGQLEDLFHAGQVMQSLRTLVSHSNSKIEAVRDIVEQFRAKDEGVLVFCWYRESAHKLGAALGVPVITGAMPATERRTTALSNPCVVATIPSLSEGVDLTHMKAVVYYEQSWTPGIQYQSLGRVRRWSDHATEPVFVYYIRARGTIDDKIALIEGRRSVSIQELLRLELT